MVNHGDDEYEHEANSVASDVVGMSMPAPDGISAHNNNVSGKAGQGGAALQRKESASSPVTTAPPLVGDVLRSSSGKPLTKQASSFMEPRFGYDFSKVRIHDNGKAAESAASVNAFAYTSGNNIVFNKGYYRPETSQGKWLLAHELTHVVQQGKANKLNDKSSANKTSTDDRTSSQPQERLSMIQNNYKDNSSMFRRDISNFSQKNPADKIEEKQQMMLKKPGSQKITRQDNSRNLRRCAGGGGFSPDTTTKTKTLKNTFGDFKVEHGLTKLPAAELGEYYIRIDMTPNAKTGKSKIGFLQSVRRGTSTGNWSTKAGDSGMDADRAARATKDGYRVDRADPSVDKTPLYGMKKNAAGNVVSRGNADTGSFGGSNPWMYDKVGVIDPSVLQFSSSAIDVATGASYGAIGWGFEYDSSRKFYKEEDPTLLSKGDARLKGRDDAITKWNSAVATSGSGIDAAPAVTD
ncbi:DUF4157 domain-containing protein [Mucilaginibacter sp. R11]|uniref:DUF4157 domain-containing protein n=2 Tax=Mucilaginibacter agri TaxID=2695265 RepID=A0A965ZL58_9SPHI|nr:DUF4157 domain-containing protein [Mucilaginibacter agri]